MSGARKGLSMKSNIVGKVAEYAPPPAFLTSLLFRH